jgi:UDP-N-acetylglucosamine--N-acetylmuramyl-(pentapeptide) pyrophosphoryl-undecaprenol N-acetylglucosamine transferase
VVHLIASLGGHLELLERVAPAFEGMRRVWITSEGARAASLRARGEEVRTLPRLDRSQRSPAALVAGIRLAVRERPTLVVTSGAGLAIPFSLTARAMGARLVFLETMARVTSGSLTGRVLSRVAADVLVQWPELRAQYPRARICRPLLLEGVDRVGRADGEGTFVTVGSHDVPFHRLLRAVEAAAEDGVLPGPVRAQVGVGESGFASVETTQFMSPDEFGEAVERARVVVCHGGAGALATVLRSGKRPLVMARRHDYGEHVDDHQLDLTAKLGALGLVVPIDDGIAPADVDTAGTPLDAPAELSVLPSLLDDLRRTVA